MIDTGLKNFTAEVIESDKPVLVDFWSHQCPPCRQQLPILTQLSNDGFKVAKVLIDDEPELAVHYGVTALPTLMLFKGGEPIDKLIGLQRYETLVKFFNKAA